MTGGGVFKRAHVTPNVAVAIAIYGANEPALVNRQRVSGVVGAVSRFPRVNGRATREERVGERCPAVVLQRAEVRTHAENVSGGANDGTPGRIADQVVALAVEGAGTIRAGAGGGTIHVVAEDRVAGIQRGRRGNIHPTPGSGFVVRKGGIEQIGGPDHFQPPARTTCFIAAEGAVDDDHGVLAGNACPVGGDISFEQAGVERDRSKTINASTVQGGRVVKNAGIPRGKICACTGKIHPAPSLRGVVPDPAVVDGEGIPHLNPAPKVSTRISVGDGDIVNFGQGKNVEDAVNTVARDDGDGFARTLEDQVIGHIQIAREAEVFACPRQGEDVISGGEVDGVGTIPGGAGIDGGVDVRGADGLAQGTVPVIVEFIRRGGNGDVRGPRGVEAPIQRGQEDEANQQKKLSETFHGSILLGEMPTAEGQRFAEGIFDLAHTARFADFAEDFARDEEEEEDLDKAEKGF